MCIRDRINSPACILASNTSSLSISVLQEKIADPQRVAGLHFFNPAQVMKLVEVVEGNETSKEVIQQLLDFCRQINKVPVHCKDAPGFIVNRVARHFYLRSLQLAENLSLIHISPGTGLRSLLPAAKYPAHFACLYLGHHQR